METLGFIHAAVDYEDPNSSPELRSLDELNFKVPNSVLMGVLSVGVMAATLNHADRADALIRYGDTGSGVSALQRSLGVRADGVFGPQTLRALERFQYNNYLSQDGVAGPQTLTALGLSANLGPGRPGGEVPVGTGAYVSSRIGLNVRDYPYGPVVYGLPTGAGVSLTGNRRNSGGLSWLQLSDGNWVAEQYISFR